MPRARAASTISSRAVDADHPRAGLGDPLGQRAVAAADVEDQLARLRVEQRQRRRAQRRHEGGVLRHNRSPTIARLGSPSDDALTGPRIALILLGVHQPVELAIVAERQLEEPALAFRIVN